MMNTQQMDFERDDLRYFEDFLKSVGFKRIEGAVYGLLVLSIDSLSSEDIQNNLKLSQAAVSNALKTLSFYGAINVSLDSDKGCRVYTANEDCLSIVSNVLQKREAQVVREYKLMMQGLLSKYSNKGKTSLDPRIMRLKSIISTCELGESIISFTTSLDSMRLKDNLYVVTEKLPQVFNIILSGAEMAQGGAELFKDKVGFKLKHYIKAFKGEERGL